MVTPYKGNRKHTCHEVEGESFSGASQMPRKSGFLLVCFHSQYAVSRYFVKMERKMNPSVGDGFWNPNAYKTGVQARILPDLTDLRPHCQIVVVSQTRSIALFWHFIWGQFQCVGCLFRTLRKLLSLYISTILPSRQKNLCTLNLVAATFCKGPHKMTV